MKGRIKNFFEKAKSSIIESDKDEENLFDSIADSILIIDKNFNITDVNKAFIELIGKEKDDIIGKKCYSLMHETEKPIEDCSSCKSFETKKKEDFELYHPELKKHFWITSSPIFENDSVSKIVHHIRDISEFKEKEEALKKEKEFSESLINTAQAIILVLDTEGKIVSSNPYMEEISGYKLNEVKGKDWFDTFLPGEDHNRIRELFKSAIRGIQTKGNINPILTKNGQKIFIEWYDKTLKDKDGKIIGLLCIGQDITKRAKFEKSLKESEEKYRNLVELSPDLIAIHDKEGIIRFINPAGLKLIKAFSKDEIIGKHVSNFLRPEDKEINPKQREGVFKKGIVEKLEGYLKLLDDSIIATETSAVSIVYEKRPCILLIVRDVTEKKKAKQEIKKRNEELERFAKLSVGREEKMMELKKRIKELENGK